MPDDPIDANAPEVLIGVAIEKVTVSLILEMISDEGSAMKYVQTAPFQISLQRLRLWPHFAREWFANRSTLARLSRTAILQQVACKPRWSAFLFLPWFVVGKAVVSAPRTWPGLGAAREWWFSIGNPRTAAINGNPQLTKTLLGDLPSAVLTAIRTMITNCPGRIRLGFNREARVIYDIVDDFSTFRINQKLLMQLHQQRMQTARLVLASAKDLVERFSQEREDILYCPNGVRMADFERRLPIPADMAELIAQEKPIAGYVGAIAEWFDMFVKGNSRCVTGGELCADWSQ
jgi:glycosyltransferase involved in cell wall biosynthesis